MTTFSEYAIDTIPPEALSKGGPRIEGKRGVQHTLLPIVQLLGGETFNVSESEAQIPLPPSFFLHIVENPAEVGEPTFDPDVHLALREPSHVALLPEFELVSPSEVPQVNSASGSRLAYTLPFDMLSPAGVQALHAVLMREKVHAHRNHRNVELRGVYYRSPFVRALMNDASLLAHFGRLIGEPVVPHKLLMDAPSVNFGESESSSVIGSTVDPWHFDSVSYVCVALVSEVESMVGGELQVLKRPKDEAIDLIEATLNRPPADEMVTLNYERAGRCILAQGSEVLHRVTRVRKALEPRMSIVMAFQPANPFQPDKTVLDTWERFDVTLGSAAFEFFRLKAHNMGGALMHLATTQHATRDREALAAKLRVVAAELERAAALINHETSDFIGFVNETDLDNRARAADAADADAGNAASSFDPVPATTATPADAIAATTADVSATADACADAEAAAAREASTESTADEKASS
uniref:Fe2OG dioxygenase domain-containing protein n=1 Tax=Chrysotila carterae TaxID=13221 RepID=A0A7S4EZ57_CHRCT